MSIFDTLVSLNTIKSDTLSEVAAKIENIIKDVSKMTFEEILLTFHYCFCGPHESRLRNIENVRECLNFVKTAGRLLIDLRFDKFENFKQIYYTDEAQKFDMCYYLLETTILINTSMYTMLTDTTITKGSLEEYGKLVIPYLCLIMDEVIVLLFLQYEFICENFYMLDDFTAINAFLDIVKERIPNRPNVKLLDRNLVSKVEMLKNSTQICKYCSKSFCISDTVVWAECDHWDLCPNCAELGFLSHVKGSVVKDDGSIEVLMKIVNCCPFCNVQVQQWTKGRYILRSLENKEVCLFLTAHGKMKPYIGHRKIQNLIKLSIKNKATVSYVMTLLFNFSIRHFVLETTISADLRPSFNFHYFAFCNFVLVELTYPKHKSGSLYLFPVYGGYIQRILKYFIVMHRGSTEKDRTMSTLLQSMNYNLKCIHLTRLQPNPE